MTDALHFAEVRQAVAWLGEKTAVELYGERDVGIAVSTREGASTRALWDSLLHPAPGESRPAVFGNGR